MANIEPLAVLDDITVLIPTLGLPILEACLQSITGGSAWPAALVVVDQGSSQQVTIWIERLQSQGMNAEHVPSEQRGRSAGLNCGLDRVKTRFVAVTDDDCIVDYNWLERMTLHLRQKPEAIVTGRVELAGNDGVPFSVVTSRVPKIYNRPQLKVHPLIGANMGVAITHVNRLGPFDEHPCISSAEDSDWGYRALRSGIPIIYDPQIMVRHFHWRDASQRRTRYRQYSRSQGGFYGKYLLSGDVLIFLQAIRDLVRGPVRWLRGIMKHDIDMVDRGRADTIELLPGIIDGLRRRRQP